MHQQGPVLEFDNISKRYHSFFRGQSVTALSGFSLRVEPGEIFGFLGPNGAGKTTAIHLALGFIFPSRGRGTMLGQPFGKAASDPQLRERTLEVLKQLDLESVAARNTGKFSRGMLQRVGLAQALVNDPDLLVLDEPTSALDPLGLISVREIVLQARQAGKTVFLSSHMLSEVEQICDRLAIVIRGRVARVGTVS